LRKVKLHIVVGYTIVTVWIRESCMIQW